MAATAKAALPPPVPAETLAWEASQRTRAGIAGIVAAVLTLGGGILQSILYGSYPPIRTVDALRDAAGESVPGGQGLATPQVRWIDDHMVELIALSVALAIGAALVVPLLGYLYRATAARPPARAAEGMRQGASIPRWALYFVLLGPLLVAVGGLAFQIGASVSVAQFISDGEFTSEAARDAVDGSVVSAGGILRSIGVLAMAFAFILVSLHAMRAGLLTRFAGVLGIIVGVLFILPISGPLPIVQAFWMIAVGFLILRRFPGGVPPAWDTGVAMPWPSQQELREQRAARSQEFLTEKDRDAAESGSEDAEDAFGEPDAPRRRSRKRR